MNVQKFLVGTACLVISAASLSAGSGGPDNFGYSWADSAEAGGPVYQWIDTSATGTVVVSGAAEVGTVILDPPMVIYGKSFGHIAISRHGFVSSNHTDFGTDDTNDCGLPVNPGIVVPAGEDRPNRIYVTHDQLEFDRTAPTTSRNSTAARIHELQTRRVR